MSTPSLTTRAWSPQLQLALQLGIATFMLFMGLAVVLMAVGAIRPDEDPTLVGRMIAFLFGLVITVLGGGLFLHPLMVLARSRGAGGKIDAALLGIRITLQRPTRNSALAAASFIPLVIGALFAINRQTWPGPDEDALIVLVGIEFLLIHGFVFLTFAALLARLPEPKPRAMGRFLVAMFLLLYATFAFQSGGVGGVVGLLYLILPNVLAFSRTDSDWQVRLTAVARWVVKFVTFMGLAMLLDARTFTGTPGIRLAFGYFALQAFIELFRVAEMPLDLGMAWEKLPPNQRSSLVSMSNTSD